MTLPWELSIKVLTMYAKCPVHSTIWNLVTVMLTTGGWGGWETRLMEVSRCNQSGEKGSLRKDPVPCRRREGVSCLEVPSAALRTCCCLLGEGPGRAPEHVG